MNESEDDRPTNESKNEDEDDRGPIDDIPSIVPDPEAPLRGEDVPDDWLNDRADDAFGTARKLVAARRTRGRETREGHPGRVGSTDGDRRARARLRPHPR